MTSTDLGASDGVYISHDSPNTESGDNFLIMPLPRGARSRPVIQSRFKAALVAPLIYVLSGCSAPRPTTAVAPKSSCAIVPSTSAPAESITVAAATPIDHAHVAVPATAAERLVFAQLYETLIDVNCDGQAYPGLASSWTTDATKTRVTLVIRDGARFWNGKPVVASDVVTAWRATDVRAVESSPLARRMADEAVVVDDRTLTVSLPDTAWLVLADPALAVYRPQYGTWAMGTGPYRVDLDTTAASRPLTLVPNGRGSAPRIIIRARSSTDPRDAIDAGADLIVTDDPVAVSYAATRASLTTVPLPWTRTYAVAAPNLAPRAATVSMPWDADNPALRVSLARDAVHAEARASEPPYWWTGIQGCTSASVTQTIVSPSARHSTRIVYRRDDRIARDLAARLVAVGRGMTTAGLAAADFARAVQAGNELAYVLDVPRASLSPCHDLDELVSSVPWVVTGTPGGPAVESLIPLVDTRARAIVSRDRVSATIDWDGTIRISGAPRQP